MANLNKVLLIGNLTRDPELRYVPSGTAVATFTIAVNRFYTTPAGEKKEQTSFIRVVVWGRRAEVSGEYLSKGSPVFVEGRLQSRAWETPDGQKRSTIEVVADNIQFLRGGDRQGSAAAKDAAATEEVATIDLSEEPPVSGDQAGTGKPAAPASDSEVPF
ncbi:MAG: single-stranded DNA-binding protein [Candidatus Omnitrophota bacterium]